MELFLPHQNDYEIGYIITHLNSEKTWMHNQDKLFPLASIAKLLAAIIACKLHENIPDELITQAISEHSTTSYEEILDIQGEVSINEYLHNHNYSITISRNNRDVHHNNGTPRSIANLLKSFLYGQFIEEPKVSIIQQALKNQLDMDGFRFDNGLWAHMTGGLNDLCADAGILDYMGELFILVGFAKSNNDNVQWHVLERALTEIGKQFLNASSVFK